MQTQQIVSNISSAGENPWSLVEKEGFRALLIQRFGHELLAFGYLK